MLLSFITCSSWIRIALEYFVPSLQSVQFFPCQPHCPLLHVAFDAAQPTMEQLLKMAPPGPGKKTEPSAWGSETEKVNLKRCKITQMGQGDVWRVNPPKPQYEGVHTAVYEINSPFLQFP